VAEEMAASRNSFAANSGKAVGYDPARVIEIRADLDTALTGRSTAVSAGVLV
jgi:hypothetical protein